MKKLKFIISFLILSNVGHSISFSDLANKAASGLSSVGQGTMNVAKSVGTTMLTGAAYGMTPMGMAGMNPMGMGMMPGMGMYPGMGMNPMGMGMMPGAGYPVPTIGSMNTNLSTWGNNAAAAVTPKTVNPNGMPMMPPMMGGMGMPYGTSPVQMMGGMLGQMAGNALLGSAMSTYGGGYGMPSMGYGNMPMQPMNTGYRPY